MSHRPQDIGTSLLFFRNALYENALPFKTGRGQLLKAGPWASGLMVAQCC